MAPWSLSASDLIACLLLLLNKHNAPSVVYPLGRSRTLLLTFAVLWFAGFVLTCFWIQASPNFGWRQMTGLAAMGLAGLTGLLAFKNSPQGNLAWDGQSWHWESASYQAATAEYELTVAADFQHALLLRINNQAHASLWFWAERSAFASRWLDLRRAVYSPHRELNQELSHELSQELTYRPTGQPS